MLKRFLSKLDRSLIFGLALPLAWALMQDVTLRTTVRVKSWWDQGYSDLYQYGFPLPFTHWGLSSSEVDVFFLLPMLLDLLVYFFLTSLLAALLGPALSSKPLWRKVLSGMAWLWAVLTMQSLLWSVLHGDLSWTTPFEVLWTTDPEFSWRKGNTLDGYGP